MASVERRGDQLQVRVEPVRITEVIRNGTLEWGPQDVGSSRGFVFSWAEPERNTAAAVGPSTRDVPPQMEPPWSFVRAAYA